MNFKRIIAIIIIAIMLTTLFFNIVIANDEKEKKVVKIGAFNIMNMQEKTDTGKYTGYSYEYLNAILPYTDWEYEYVEGTITDCIEWLKTGEIDIMGFLTKTPEREESYDFVDYFSGYNGTKIIVKNDNTKYATNDYNQFNNIVIGVQNGTSQTTKLIEFSKENGFNVEIISFDNEKDLLSALKEGKIEAACDSSLKIEEWTRVIAMFDITPYYYAVTKGNTELLNEFNNAIGLKKIDDPTFEETLRKKYHVNESKKSIVLSSAEKDYIASADTIKVAFDSKFMPIESYDKKTDSPRGYSIEVLNRITEITGLQFEFVTTDSYTQTLQLIIDNEVDILSSFNNSILSMPENRMSNYYLDLNIVLMGKNDFNLNPYDEVIIAVPLRDLDFVGVIRSLYPNGRILYFDSGEDAHDAVLNGEADLAARNLYSAQLDVASKYSDLRIINDLGKSTQSRFLFSEDMPEELKSIFDKCISSFSEAESNAMMMRVTIDRIDTDTSRQKDLIISTIALMLCGLVTWLVLKLRRARQRLLRAAYFDELTGLPNLTKFKKDAKKLLEENTNHSYAILLTDIAHFSIINEKYGFHVGNLVIRSVGQNLSKLTALSTLTARISSNMFIHLYIYDEREERIITTNPRLHSYKYKDTFIEFSHYLGRYLIPFGETDIDAIYEKASYAHLFAKKNGIKSRIVDYDHEAKNMSIRNQEIESKMENALLKKDFLLYLQPKYKCDGKSLTGAEALVRWFDSTTEQMIFPNDFIPLFEQNGFVTKLDFYMFEEVCKILAQWKKSGFELLTISVNFSRLHFTNPNMADELLTITKKYAIEPKYLEIEVTENALSTEVSEISSMIKTLSSYGFKISLDDFSSQNSSFLFLAEVPVDVVKLDRSFVSAITETKVSYILVDGTIQILKKLDVEIVAEGVETDEQVQLLDTMHCDIIQGYIFSKPIPANDMTTILTVQKKKLS